jgi:Cu/Zn superoxide dismutase
MHNFTVRRMGVPESAELGCHLEMTATAFSNGGTALVIHAKADDLKTDPQEMREIASRAGDQEVGVVWVCDIACYVAIASECGYGLI